MSAERKYEVYKLIISEIALQTNQNEAEFDRLKKMKLLYFFCALSSQKAFFYDIFNNFFALPLGPVESDVYTIEKNGIGNPYTSNEDPALFQKINSTINEIVERFPLLFKANSWRLVALSHESKVWIKSFNLAKQNKKLSYKMDSEELISEVLFN